jgi:hypothetical protein
MITKETGPRLQSSWFVPNFLSKLLVLAQKKGNGMLFAAEKQLYMSSVHTNTYTPATGTNHDKVQKGERGLH